MSNNDVNQRSYSLQYILFKPLLLCNSVQQYKETYLVVGRMYVIPALLTLFFLLFFIREFSITRDD